jgi:hypothetical protein
LILYVSSTRAFNLTKYSPSSSNKREQNALETYHTVYHYDIHCHWSSYMSTSHSSLNLPVIQAAYLGLSESHMEHLEERHYVHNPA